MGRLKILKEALFGSPKSPDGIKETGVAVLGVIEQSYGKYMLPSFKQQIDVFWNDPLITEAVLMFSEQVLSTGFYITGNPEYTLKLNEKTAVDIINEWCDDNNLDVKLPDIVVELKAFGNSFWRIVDDGFVKTPVESIWRAVRIEADIPLQIKYNLQLVPIYGSKIIPWGEFIHFKMGVTGYHAPFGRGVMWGLLAKPVDSTGKIYPSLYDVRLSMRGSLTEGFRKFSFGNELWVFEGMSNADFEESEIGEKIAKMSSTGNRIATNTKGQIHLAVPERTQSYDQFIKQMQDEFMMSLADPSLKLGLEKGFTKATSETASDMYKLKVSNMRKVIKQHLEDLFKVILEREGYDGKEAKIELHFGPEESPSYVIKDVLLAESRGIITKDEARKIFSKYNKWDITGNIPGGDKPSEPIPIPGEPGVKPSGDVDELKKKDKDLDGEITDIEERKKAESLKKDIEIKNKKLKVLKELLGEK